MVIGNTITLTKEWVQLANDSDNFVIQNVGNGLAILKFSTLVPSDDAKGHHCSKDDGISSNIFGQGNVWGRALVTTDVEVTK